MKLTFRAVTLRQRKFEESLFCRSRAAFSNRICGTNKQSQEIFNLTLTLQHRSYQFSLY